MINSFIRVQKNDSAPIAKSADVRFPVCANRRDQTVRKVPGLGLWDVSPVPALTFDRVWTVWRQFRAFCRRLP